VIEGGELVRIARTLRKIEERIAELEAKLEKQQAVINAAFAVVKSHQLYQYKNVVGAKPLDNLRKALDYD